MGVNSLPKTVTRQRRDCDLNPGPSAPESSTLTTRLSNHPRITGKILFSKVTLACDPAAELLTNVLLGCAIQKVDTCLQCRQ